MCGSVVMCDYVVKYHDLVKCDYVVLCLKYDTVVWYIIMRLYVIIW